jgi:nitrogen regulatory protein PII
VLKFVRALLHSSDLDRAVAALEREGFHGMTIGEIVHCDSQRGGRAHVTLRNQLSVAVQAERVERLLRALHAAKCTRDVEVTLEPLSKAVRIRTGELDEAAVWE